MDVATEPKVKDILRTQMNRIIAEMRGMFLFHDYHFLQAEMARYSKQDIQVNLYDFRACAFYRL